MQFLTAEKQGSIRCFLLVPGASSIQLVKTIPSLSPTPLCAVDFYDNYLGALAMDQTVHVWKGAFSDIRDFDDVEKAVPVAELAAPSSCATSPGTQVSQGALTIFRFPPLPNNTYFSLYLKHIYIYSFLILLEL